MHSWVLWTRGTYLAAEMDVIVDPVRAEGGQCAMVGLLADVVACYFISFGHQQEGELYVVSFYEDYITCPARVDLGDPPLVRLLLGDGLEDALCHGRAAYVA